MIYILANKEIPLHVVLVEAWVKRGNKYLVAKRSSKDDQSAGKWALPGGKVEIEVSENLVEDTLRRELMEEVGIEIGNVRYFASRSFIRSSGHHVVALSFLAEYRSGKAMPLEDQEEVKWVTIAEAESLLGDHWKGTLYSLKKLC